MSYHRVLDNTKEEDVISFTLGEIHDFHDRGIIEFGSELYHYQPPRGREELLDRILNSKEKYGTFSSKQLCLTVGAKQGIQLSFEAMRRKLRRVIIPRPGWAPYKILAAEHEYDVIYYNPMEAHLLPQIIRENPGALTVINYPNNPTGMSLSEVLLERIIDANETSTGWLLSDEVYSSLIPGHPSALSFVSTSSQIIVVDSISKSLAAAGLRLGYLLSNSTFVAEILKGISISVSGTSSLSQLVATNLISSNKLGEALCKRVNSDRLLLSKVFREHSIEVLSEGGPYLWVRGGPDFEMSNWTVRGVSGSVFGAPGFTRFCATSNPVGLEKLISV